MAVKGYSRAQIRLHWAVMILVVLQFLLHDGIANAFDEGLEAGTLTISAPVIGHFVGGLLITFLVIWRFMLRQERGVPPPPEGEPAVFSMAGRAAHAGFYVILLLLPATGAIAWGSASAGASLAHEILRAALFFLILAHIGAVAVHQFVWKTGLLQRMITPVD